MLNITPAEGVAVEIEHADSRAVTKVSTLRERPVFLSLAEGLYRMRFSQPVMSVGPVGANAQYMVTGLPTDSQDTIEVPVLARHGALALVEASCRAPVSGQPVEDLATCTFGAPDGGAP